MNGNPHKIHKGYRRAEEKRTSSEMISIGTLQMQLDAREELQELLSYDCDYDFDDPLMETLMAHEKPENFWKNQPDYNSEDNGMGLFRSSVNDVLAKDIPKHQMGWVARKYDLLCSLLAGKQFRMDFLDEPSGIFYRYCQALEEQLRRHGIDFSVFKGITKAGWETYRIKMMLSDI